MQHPTRRAAWQARNVAAIVAMLEQPHSPHLIPAAIAARMELRRRLTAEAVAALLQGATA